MATYTAIYEIAPNAKFFSEESFLDEIKPAVNIISTLSESFGGCKPKIEIISNAPYEARITISLSPLRYYWRLHCVLYGRYLRRSTPFVQIT